MYSNALKLLDLNDYLAPEDECVVITKGKKITIKPSDELSVKSEAPAPVPAKIALTDCLACSGCVTSSEKILVEEQNAAKFVNLLPNFDFKILLISPQSLAALAVQFSLGELATLQKISQFLEEKFGINLTLDIQGFVSLANEFAFREFIHHAGTPGLPILSSECPGFVCYAEKVLDPEVVSAISKVKPPHLIAAKIVRELARGDPKNCKIFCGLIAPCFDKKLEAAREELKSKTSLIDVVLSTEELFQFLRLEGFDPSQIPPQNRPTITSSFLLQSLENGVADATNLKLFCQKIQKPEIELLEFRTSEQHVDSNGYVDYILQKLKSLGGVTEVTALVRKPKKYVDITVQKDDGSTLLFGLVYGFKNIQNLVSMIKSKKKKYVYCEVMACPSACVGGGGQIVGNSLQELNNNIIRVREVVLSKEFLSTLAFSKKLADQFSGGPLEHMLPAVFLKYELESFRLKEGIKESW